MEQFEQELVNNIKARIIKKSERPKFSETRLGVFLSTDWVEYYMDQLAYKMYLRRLGRENQETLALNTLYVAHESEFVEDKQSSEIAPQMVEQDNDGTLYYTYDDNTVEKRKPKYILSSIFPSKEIQDEVMDYIGYLDECELDKKRKKLFCKYLSISEDEIELLSWEEIDEAILYKHNHRFQKSGKSLIRKGE